MANEIQTVEFSPTEHLTDREVANSIIDFASKYLQLFRALPEFQNAVLNDYLYGSELGQQSDRIRLNLRGTEVDMSLKPFTESGGSLSILRKWTEHQVVVTQDLSATLVGTNKGCLIYSERRNGDEVGSGFTFTNHRTALVCAENLLQQLVGDSQSS
jgi:hypothetical protein